MDKATTKQDKRSSSRNRIAGVTPYLVFILLGALVADLVNIPLRSVMLPLEAPPSRPAKPQQEKFTSKSSYSSINKRNIFSVDGSIPDSLALLAKKAQEGEAQEEKNDSAPVPSALPLQLVGTMVHSNPARSIANIEIRSKNTVVAVKTGNDIDNLANLLQVERGKIIFRNLSNQRLEYIEIKNLFKTPQHAPTKKAGPPTTGKDEVKMVGQNKYEIKRTDVLKFTSDMSSVLQQAAMQPRRKANGEIDGFKFLNIQPGSIYTKLGFQVGDVIKSVNGETVDSPARALELYQALKGSSKISVTIERDGRDIDNEYNIN